MEYVIYGTIVCFVVYVVICFIVSLFSISPKKAEKIWMRDGGAFGQRERYTHHYNRKGKRTGKSVRYY